MSNLQELWIAVEWGFKANEKGWNLERTRDEFLKLCLEKEKEHASMSELPKQRK